MNCQEVWNKNILQWITLCKMKHLTKRIWKLECRSWPVFVCQLEAVQQKLDSQETDIFFFDRLTGSWQSGTDHFTDQSFHWNRNSKHNKTSMVEWSSFSPSLPQSLLLFTIYLLKFTISLTVNGNEGRKTSACGLQWSAIEHSYGNSAI